MFRFFLFKATLATEPQQVLTFYWFLSHEFRLIYEAQVRQLERGRYDCLIKQVRDNGETYGWSSELVNTVDALFAQNN